MFQSPPAKSRPEFAALDFRISMANETGRVGKNMGAKKYRKEPETQITAEAR